MTDQGTKAWIRAYGMAMKLYPKSIRDCRIFSMAYEMGWKNGRRTRRAARPVGERAK
jgi:hypothetical protein